MKEYVAEYIVPVEKKGNDCMFDFMNAKPLIRCRECKHAKKIYIKNLPWLKQWKYSCGYFNTDSVNGDWFCSQAEPKEKET